MRLLIAIEENDGLNSKLSAHFGHCKQFAIYEDVSKKLSFVNNDLDHSNEQKTPVDQILVHQPTAIFSLNMGKKAIDLFKKANIDLKSGRYSTVKEVIENLDNLTDLSAGCNHHH